MALHRHVPPHFPANRQPAPHLSGASSSTRFSTVCPIGSMLCVISPTRTSGSRASASSATSSELEV